jgi:hypothetical protein
LIATGFYMTGRRILKKQIDLSSLYRLGVWKLGACNCRRT